MKFWITVLAVVGCSACGADIMPQIGKALSKGLDAYTAVDRAQTKITEAAALMCSEPPAEIVNMCADVIQSIAVADQYNDVARGALVTAISVYNAVNDELLEDGADAGTP